MSNMGRTDNAKRNLIWGFIQKIVSVLIPFVSRTIMIYVLGMEYIGLNSLFASILSMLSFAELVSVVHLFLACTSR